jgi:hypothetical protein
MMAVTLVAVGTNILQMGLMNVRDNREPIFTVRVQTIINMLDLIVLIRSEPGIKVGTKVT